MYKKRFFTNETVDKLDRLLHFLFKNEIEYSFHVEEDKFGERIYRVFWFQPVF